MSREARTFGGAHAIRLLTLAWRVTEGASATDLLDVIAEIAIDGSEVTAGYLLGLGLTEGQLAGPPDAYASTPSKDST